MKVGDLVECLTGSCGTAIIVEFHKTSGLYWIMMTRNGRMCAFQPQHLRVISLGGGARNPPWRRLRERRLGCPVLSCTMPPAAGVARLALQALNEGESAQQH